jgi:hypothetical protein
VLGTLALTTWTVIAQAAQGLRDRELLSVAGHAAGETRRELSWLDTRIVSS